MKLLNKYEFIAEAFKIFYRISRFHLLISCIYYFRANIITHLLEKYDWLKKIFQIQNFLNDWEGGRPDWNSAKPDEIDDCTHSDLNYLLFYSIWLVEFSGKWDYLQFAIFHRNKERLNENIDFSPYKKKRFYQKICRSVSFLLSIIIH